MILIDFIILNWFILSNPKEFMDGLKSESASGLRAYEAGKGLSKGTFKEFFSEEELKRKFGEENTKEYLKDLRNTKDSNYIKTIEDFRLKKSQSKQINNEDLQIRESILTDNKGNLIGIKNNNIDIKTKTESFKKSNDKVITNEYFKQNVSNELPYRFSDNINKSYVDSAKDNITMLLDTDVRGYDFSLKEGTSSVLLNDKNNNITKEDISRISNMLVDYDVMERSDSGINITKKVGNDTYTLGLELDNNEQRIIVSDYRKVRGNNTNPMLPLKNKNSSVINIEEDIQRGYNNTKEPALNEYTKGETENERIQETLPGRRNDSRTSERIFERNKQQERLGYDGRGTSQQSSSRRNNKRREYKGSESLRESFLLRQSSKNGKEIRRIVENAKENNPMGCCVDVHSAEEYDTYKNFVLPDNMGNVSVKPDGDIVSVAKSSNSKIKGALQIFMNTAIENGGIKLDCYGKLAKYYAPYGFEAVARVEFNEEYAPGDWNYELLGKPYVYVMRYNPNIDTKNQDLESVRTFNKDQYDEAIAYRDSLIDNETPKDGVFFDNKNTEETETVKLLKQMQKQMQQMQRQTQSQMQQMQGQMQRLKEENSALREEIRDSRGRDTNVDTIIKQSNIKESLSREVVRRDSENISKEEIEVIKKEYENAIDDGLIRYIENINKGEKVKPYHNIGNISKELVEDVRKLTGLDITGYKNSIDSIAVEHIWDRHGENGEADNSMSDINDIARIGYVLDNYDSVKLGDKQSVRYFNKDKSRADSIILTKRINGYYEIVEAVPDTKNKLIRVETAYQYKKKKQLTNYSNAANNDPKYTSETSFGNLAPSNESIAQKGINNNSKGASKDTASFGHQRMIFDEKGNVIRIEKREHPFGNSFDNEVFKANALKKLKVPTKQGSKQASNAAEVKGASKVINQINDFIESEVKKGDLSKEDAITYFNKFDDIGQAFVNDGHYIEKFGKKIKNEKLKLYYNNILHAYKASETCLGAFQVDHRGRKVGESVYKILEPVMDRMDDFNDYLHHRLNIDRWKTGKALDENVSAAESLEIVKDINKKEVRILTSFIILFSRIFLFFHF